MKKYIPLIIGILAMALLLIFAIGPGRAQETSPDGGRTVSSEVSLSSNFIPIQGRLTDAGGNPLNGTYLITFRLYDVYEGGTAICADTQSVFVDSGLFSTYFQGCSTALDGRQLYLGIQVESDSEMTPRQYIDNVPYAWTLRPGANISGTIGTDAILDIDNYSPTGRGIRAEAQGTTGINYAVVGASRSLSGLRRVFLQ